MLWSGLIKINKIVNNDVNSYLLYIDPLKSNESFKIISSNKEVNDKEIVLNVQLNPLMLCNSYDKFKIKTTKKFIDIDFINSNVFIKLDINDDNTIHVKTMTKSEIQSQSQTNTKKKEYKITNTSIRKRFTSELIDICKKIDK
jgi:hypothetical protein